jgi:hypothetical protein
VKTLYLVSCVKEKATRPAPADELYISTWFQKAREYVLACKAPDDTWYILSAKYHLVEPRTVLQPYDDTLKDMPRAQRSRWAEKVLTQIGQILLAEDRIVFLAGQRYREFLEPALLSSGHRVEAPMRGLGIGQQLQWLGVAAAKRKQGA